MIDSYLNDELLIETNHEVLRHLESCTACRSELAAHRALQTRLRAAVKSAPEMRINPVFARRLEANLRQTALRPTVWRKLKSRVFSGSPILAATASACLLFGALFGANWLRHSSPATENNIAGQSQTNQRIENSRPPEESSQPEAVRAAWRELTREAFGDHENCALHFRLKENPITMDEAAEKYGKFNKDLDRTVIASVRKIFSEKTLAKKAAKSNFSKLIRASLKDDASPTWLRGAATEQFRFS